MNTIAQDMKRLNRQVVETLKSKFPVTTLVHENEGGNGSILVYNREKPLPHTCGGRVFWNTSFSSPYKAFISPYKAFIRLDPYYIDTGRGNSYAGIWAKWEEGKWCFNEQRLLDETIKIIEKINNKIDSDIQHENSQGNLLKAVLNTLDTRFEVYPNGIRDDWVGARILHRVELRVSQPTDDHFSVKATLYLEKVVVDKLKDVVTNLVKVVQDNSEEEEQTK